MENMKPHYDLLDDYIRLRVYFKNQGYSERFNIIKNTLGCRNTVDFHLR